VTGGHLISGPTEMNVPGYDGVVYVWEVGPKKVEVRFTATALAVGVEGLSTRAEKALLTKGESEMAEFVQWKEVPDEIEFSTDNHPWVTGGELD
jgi:hypothetical protein